MKRIIYVLCLFLITSLITPVSALYNNSTAMACVLKRVENAVETYSSSVDVTDCHISVSELTDFFYEASAGTTYRDLISSFSYKYSRNYVYSLSFSYRFDRTTTNKIITQFNEEVEKVLASIEPSMNDLDKLFYLHNYLVLNTKYDEATANLVVNTNSLNIPAENALSFASEGPLVNKTAVCSGYSQSYMYLLGKLGIEAKYLTSNSMNHGWNIVKYNGNWYHVDVTFDDPIPDVLGYVDYKYFMMNSSEISEDHSWDDTSFKANSSALAASNYIFNQDIKDATYYNGLWYYVKNNALYRSHIDGSGLELIYNKDSILDFVLVDETIYYTTTKNNYFALSLREMDLNQTYNMELQSFANGVYQPGLYYDNGELYLTKRSGESDHYPASESKVVFKSYLRRVYNGDESLKGEIDAYEVFKNVERDTSGKLQLMLDGKKHDYYFDLKDRGSCYTFEVPYSTLTSDTYTLKIVVDDIIYDFLDSDSDSFTKEIGEMSIEYGNGILKFNDGSVEEEIDLSPYSLFNMDVYQNSRVTSITPTSNGFKVNGYMFEAHANCHKPSSIWREIVFVSVDDQSTEYAYRSLVTPLKNKWLNTNPNATDNYKYDLSYANYEVEVNPKSMYAYSDGLNKYPLAMRSGTYYAYMRISNGKTSYLFPLKDVTLSTGANLENTGMLPAGFSILDQESRQLIYTVY